MGEVINIRPVEQVDYGPALGTVRAEMLRRKLGKSKHIPAPKTCPKEEWPPDYDQVRAWRAHQADLWTENPERIAKAKRFYKHHPVDFINHWCDTFDPRKLAKGQATRFPLIMFPKQEELVNFVLALIKAEAPGLVEKSRDMGATWICICLSVWLWLFWDSSAVGWGSNKQDKVDRLGVPDSIFEKIRMLILSLPRELLPEGFEENKHLYYLRCINPENGSIIAGEIGDNIGRGGRTLIYFVDEAAHLTHPDKVEAALSDTSRVKVYISSVSGLGTVFHRRREAGKDWVPGEPAVKGQTNVIVMDWSDHPEKTSEWHDTRKKEFTDSGLTHVFAREVERDYAAAVEGIIIPADWVRAVMDAHEKLGFDDSGAWSGALDVADEGLDANAFSARKGPILRKLHEWGDRDVGATTRRAIGHCQDALPMLLMYDAIGVGAGVKAEANRLKEEKLLPQGLVFVPWFASAEVLNPYENLIPGDKNTPLNRDFYQNLKAQAWWMARQRFERTYRAVTEGIKYKPEELISIPSSLPLARKLQAELSQPVSKRQTSTMKLLVDKKPDGAKSPNMADSFVMNLWPVPPPQLPRVSLVAPIVIRGEG